MNEDQAAFGESQLGEYIDADELMEDLGIDEEEIAWRKGFVEFDTEDEHHLSEYTEIFSDHVDDIADGFYDHLMNYEETTAVINRSPKSVDDLKGMQKAYLMTLSSGQYDKSYFRNRARIGKLHELLDMPIKHYIGQYNVYYTLLLDIIADQLHSQLTTTVETTLARECGIDSELDIDPTRLSRRIYEDVEDRLDDLHSLLKILNLDMQVAVETYLQSRINDIEIERDRFAALFENVPSPVVAVRITDDGMRVVNVNTAFENLFEYTAADLGDQHFERVLTPEGEEPRPIEERGIVENIETSTESELSEAEVTLETQFGQREFIRVSAPVDSPNVENLEYAFYIDVTDQKQRRERLQVLSRVMRHNIRNRLTAVQGCAQTLAETVETDNDMELATRIEDSAKDLLETSESIYEIEQHIAGDGEHHPVNPASRIEQVLGEMREEYNHCEFSAPVASDLWVRGTDAFDIALRELIQNAIEHNDAQTPEVDVSVIESLDNKNVDIRVADNGPGIPPGEYEVLTGQRERSKIQHMTGVGLWAVNWIVTRAGGSLEFSANSPRGSIVTMHLPQTDPPKGSEKNS